MVKILLSIILCLGSVAQASFHVSDHPDEDFVTLGQNYPAVGRIRYEGNFHSGVGTLVDVSSLGSEFSHLQGRVVLSAAHLFAPFVVGDDVPPVLFELEGCDPVYATPHSHPLFQQLIPEQMCFSYPYDIAVMILGKPINKRGAPLSLNTDFKDMLDHYYVSVGYGRSGHVLGVNDVMDEKKRASYLYANRFQEETPPDLSHTYFIKNEKNVFPVPIEKNSILMLYPYIGEFSVPDYSIIPDKIVGLAGGGDSGGGVFDEGGQLVAIISASGFTDQCVNWCIEESLYTQHGANVYGSFIDRQEAYKEEHEEVKPYPDALAHFLEEETLLENIYVFKADQDINHLFERKKEPTILEKFQDEFSGINVVIAFHKDWILETLRQVEK